MKIVPYDPKYKKDFIEMNRHWISEMFELEKQDILVLENFEKSLEKGGQIFFAVDENEEVLACCLIGPLPNGEWEILNNSLLKEQILHLNRYFNIS